ncbi:hypothetical protein BDV96DRAFT_201799 [Lophiotrema nucula]|uniref:Uncharacterized protein n=1 Tax=Lophiotrema nucula TaxID=690887 RepID=A0A6A5YT90_9PLEO|nr:hypothetical protein BDV96DRAFT_201799 [Lophiotrema nucula]
MMVGRPSSIDDAEVTAQAPDETLLEGQELRLNMFWKALELAKMSYSIRRRACFAEHSHEECVSSLMVAKALMRELDDWRATLPRHLQVDSSVPLKQKRSICLFHTY